MKSKTIDSFFKKKSTETTQLPSEVSQIDVPPSSFAPLNSDARPSKISRVEDKALDLSNLEREPGLCKQIYEYPVNMRDEIRRAYIKVVPYQPILSEYLASNSKKHPRYFQPPWFKQFSWLEYSPSKDVVFCLPCFLFNSNPTSRFGSTAFTHNGFSNWKKVHDGCNCAFLTHMGKDPNSLYNNAQRAYVDLMNQAQHIEVSLDRQTTQQISANPLRHDESSGSKNCGNFLELLSLLASYDEKVEDVLKSAPQNASYTSSTIQKEILHIYASRVRNVIREEIGDRKFSIIMDEERDESKKEQMAIILRFFDKQRQLREVVEVHQFFKDLSDIVNIASTSSKRHNELQKAQAAEISHLVSINELATGTGMNQIGTLQCPDTQLQEFKSRFNKNVVELLTLTTALDPKEFFKLFDIDKICILVNKFYPEEFSQQEKERLPYELKHYELDVCKHPDLRKISTLSELCRSLVESGKSVMYPLVDRFIRLILTRLRSKMEDDFLRSSLVMYIEKEIAEKFDINEIIDDFSSAFGSVGSSLSGTSADYIVGSSSASGSSLSSTHCCRTDSPALW
ncbi:uncharacterized protein LOC108484949 [Gossypium arboreum]|uniref:uncharacterized protein LOC108484949 n=1 Tax=Gossypium arboreum TaxID=29729 RepID=UPI0022F1BC6A|nr:uncharacterized protein LOC108484949 [Gossypium arboreum]